MDLPKNRRPSFKPPDVPSMAFSMVISSAYSMSLPTGMPIAIRVTFSRHVAIGRKISRRRLAFDGRIGGQDHFVHLTVLHPPHQIGNAQLLRAHSMQRRNRAMQHVVHAVKMLGLLDGGDVGRFFHDANQPLIARCAAAIDARINIGNIVADGAQAQAGLHVAHRAASNSASSSLERRI